MNFKFIKDEFNSKHKIDDHQYLDMYIQYLLNYQLNENENCYTEKHHILPVSTFPEYKDSNWNLIEIKYECHKIVHLWIFKAINIREYQRPLNWMVSDYKNSQEISKAAKNGWEKFKKNPEKYKKFCDTRSIYMSTLTSVEQRRRAFLFWNKISDEEYIEFCNKMKSIWTLDKKMQKSYEMKKFYSVEGNKLRKSQETQERWDSMDESKRSEF